MITPKTVVNWLKMNLPRYCDYFSETITVESASISGSILTITSNSHGLLNGNHVNISNAILKNKIISAVKEVDGAVKFTTQYAHDVTAAMTEDRPSRSWPTGLEVIIEVDTIETVYKLDPSTEGIPNENTLVTDYEEDYTAPDVSGDAYLLELRGYGVNDIWEISNVTANTFEIDLSQKNTPQLPEGPVDGILLSTSINIFSAADIERSEKHYTSKNTDKFAAYVVHEDMDVDKSLLIQDGGVAAGRDNEGELITLGRIQVLVFIPTHEESTGGFAQEIAVNDLMQIILSILHMRTIEDEDQSLEDADTNPDVMYLSDSGTLRYNSAFYGYGYRFEVRGIIDKTDGFINDRTVAFKTLNYTHKQIQDGELNANIEFR